MPCLTIFLTVWAATIGGTAASDRESPKLRELLRRPVALAAGRANELLVANHRSGSISVFDTHRREVRSEWFVGESLSDLERLSSDRWIAVDQSRHEAILLQSAGEGDLTVASRTPTPSYPVSIERLSSRAIGVASLWSRQWSEYQWDGDGELESAGVIDLPFAPRNQLALPDGEHVLIADAFANRIAVVRRRPNATPRLLHVREFPCHHIRGLRLSPSGEHVLIAHQMLNHLARTVRNDVHWGLLMSNDVRWIRVDALLDPTADLYVGARVTTLGEPGDGSADPSDLAWGPGGALLVTLGGVDEIAVASGDRMQIRRVHVGRRPVAVAADARGDRLWVANMLDDSLSEVDLTTYEARAATPLGPTPTLTAAQRGELVFYNAALSHDGWMSCHSCHIDGHSNAMLNDNFSDASFGAPKRVLSLLGRRDTAPFAWNGDAADLETQIRKSIQQTMQSDVEPAPERVQDLAAYLRTLDPPPSIDAARRRRNEPQTQRGRALFDALRCGQCHAPPTYTTPATYDVGLEDELGMSRFNPPTLLGVGQRSPFFHDGRAAELEDVFTTHGHQLRRRLSEDELQSLLAFLRSL